MIKANVITKNTIWYKFIKKPNNYIDRKINKLNLKKKELKKNIIHFTLLLSGEREIINLNKKFRGKKKSTDVLSFPFYTKRELQKKLKNEKEVYLGDIIININKIKNNKETKNFKIEFDNLWIHGLVHLFGYDHKKENDYMKMNKIEKNYFRYINV